jgi:hypothetical protein
MATSMTVPRRQALWKKKLLNDFQINISSSLALPKDDLDNLDSFLNEHLSPAYLQISSISHSRFSFTWLRIYLSIILNVNNKTSSNNAESV